MKSFNCYGCNLHNQCYMQNIECRFIEDAFCIHRQTVLELMKLDYNSNQQFIKREEQSELENIKNGDIGLIKRIDEEPSSRMEFKMDFGGNDGVNK